MGDPTSDDDWQTTRLDRPAVDVANLSRRDSAGPELVDDWNDTELDRAAVDFDRIAAPPTGAGREPERRPSEEATPPGRRPPVAAEAPRAHAVQRPSPGRVDPPRRVRTAADAKRDLLLVAVGVAALLLLLVGGVLAVVLMGGHG